jgi:hypothetical protein
MDKEKDTKRPVANKQQVSPAKAPPSPELRELSPRRTRLLRLLALLVQKYKY